MRDLKLDQLRTFTEVIASGSFSAAAEKLQLTQPAVSPGAPAGEAGLDSPAPASGERQRGQRVALNGLALGVIQRPILRIEWGRRRRTQ